MRRAINPARDGAEGHAGAWEESLGNWVNMCVTTEPAFTRMWNMDESERERYEGRYGMQGCCVV